MATNDKQINVGDQAGTGLEPRVEVVEVFEYTIAYRVVGEKVRVMLTTKEAWFKQLEYDQEYHRHQSLINEKFDKA